MKRQNILQLNRQINIIMLKYASNFTVIMDTDTLFLQLRIFLQQLFHQVIGILGKIQGIVYLHREGIVRWFDSKYSQCVEICNWNGDVAKEKWPLNTFSIQGLFILLSSKKINDIEDDEQRGMLKCISLFFYIFFYKKFAYKRWNF